MKLADEHLAVLAQLADGSTLKSHRTIDGEKIYRLHTLDGAVELPPAQIVDTLKKHRYIDSNKKFPAATYLLTDKGQTALAAVRTGKITTLSARNYAC